MVYIEMARDPVHGGDSWSFLNSIWSPTRTSDGHSWPYWEKVRQVRKGDVIIHLRGVPPNAYFTGYSVAAGDGGIAPGRPPHPAEWAFAEQFYRADLEHNAGFFDAINLDDIFSSRGNLLEAYFYGNRDRRADKLHLFFVRQSGRLRCQNGAYLSDADDELLDILFGTDAIDASARAGDLPVSIATSTQIAQIKARRGQQQFADTIKSLYGEQCCFPGCTVRDRRFLVGAHIARWSDDESLRGTPGNGLCLCLVHDKAFETGMFTIDGQFRVAVHPEERRRDSAIAVAIAREHGKPIRLARIRPSVAALQQHWERIEFVP